MWSAYKLLYVVLSCKQFIVLVAAFHLHICKQVKRKVGGVFQVDGTNTIFWWHCLCMVYTFQDRNVGCNIHAKLHLLNLTRVYQCYFSYFRSNYYSPLVLYQWWMYRLVVIVCVSIRLPVRTHISVTAGRNFIYWTWWWAMIWAWFPSFQYFYMVWYPRPTDKNVCFWNRFQW